MENISNLDIIDSFRTINTEIRNEVEHALIQSHRKDLVKIIAVSKTKPTDMLLAAYNADIKVFGENYVQELVDKHQYFQSININDIEWHFIGHLQTNKAKYIVPFVDYIHSVDSLKLAEEINKRAAQNNKIQKILLQINTSGELSKSGCEPSEALNLAQQVITLSNISIKGLMTIGSFTDNVPLQRKEFSMLKNILKQINDSLNLQLQELSMGMSHDYPIAISEGATMLRIGTAYFGERNYNK